MLLIRNSVYSFDYSVGWLCLTAAIQAREEGGAGSSHRRCISLGFFGAARACNTEYPRQDMEEDEVAQRPASSPIERLSAEALSYVALSPGLARKAVPLELVLLCPSNFIFLTDFLSGFGARAQRVDVPSGPRDDVFLATREARSDQGTQAYVLGTACAENGDGVQVLDVAGSEKPLVSERRAPMDLAFFWLEAEEYRTLAGRSGDLRRQADKIFTTYFAPRGDRASIWAEQASPICFLAFAPLGTLYRSTVDEQLLQLTPRVCRPSLL